MSRQLQRYSKQQGLETIVMRGFAERMAYLHLITLHVRRYNLPRIAQI